MSIAIAYYVILTYPFLLCITIVNLYRYIMYISIVNIEWQHAKNIEVSLVKILFKGGSSLRAFFRNSTVCLNLQ